MVKNSRKGPIPGADEAERSQSRGFELTAHQPFLALPLFLSYLSTPTCRAPLCHQHFLMRGRKATELAMEKRNAQLFLE